MSEFELGKLADAIIANDGDQKCWMCHLDFEEEYDRLAPISEVVK